MKYVGLLFSLVGVVAAAIHAYAYAEAGRWLLLAFCVLAFGFSVEVLFRTRRRSRR